MVNVTSIKRASNHKVDHFFLHLIQVSTKAFEPGRNLSSDKQDARFQGNHEDKYRVTFKHTGDGFLIYAVCEYDYTINFYLRNVPPSKKWIDKGNSPNHSQFFMLDALLD